ncbi:MAG: tripartite tricarboxylate transporter substrate binding protein [Betaproteobacteria bacterium]|nr:tripartite tricarboxylate transporter substrate binding protein [Betaproteobacteria bacterium]
MQLARSIVSTVLIGMSVLAAGAACGQAFPSKPIRIVTSPVGGTNDIMARLIAQETAAPLGVPVIVDNRGGGGNVYGDVVAKSAPDGHTLLVTGNAFWTGPLLRKAPFDPLTDFATVTLATTSPNVIVVHPSLPVKSVKDLIALAKARPGELNYASGQIGSGTHLAGELFGIMAHVKIVRVSYKGAGPALNGVITGEAQLMFAIAGSALPHMKSGRLRALAVSSLEPSPLVPGLPTIASAGLPGYEALQIQGVWAPAKTPAAVVNRLKDEIVRVLNQPTVKKRLFDSGLEVVGSTPKAFADFLEADMAKLRKLFQDLGIKAQ